MSQSATIAFPSGESAWPDASNTGSSGTLTDLTGYTVTTPSTTIENRNIIGTMEVSAANVTFRNCTFNAGYWGLYHNSGTGLLIEDCTFLGGAAGIAADQESGSGGWIIRRCDISGGDDGCKLGGTDVLFEDNYIHDLFNYTGGGDPHHDGIQCGSASGMTFRHNYISSKDTSSIAMFQGQGTWSNITIDNNFFTGTPGYHIYWPGSSGTAPMVCTDNVFDTAGGYDYVTDWNSAWTWSGNVDDVGDPVAEP